MIKPPVSRYTVSDSVKQRLGRRRSRKKSGVAFDAVEKICEGIHERYIIDIEWFKRRIEQKLRKVG